MSLDETIKTELSVDMSEVRNNDMEYPEVVEGDYSETEVEG